eukprot:TRINITY_DN6094_c0_g1_i1.p1 TRINITY_DN6094_c0_g1~~TRINITY_DN6094_c0_g1_i1.p1  ORF type:complete len:260 (-),score=47.96 TRINITY_DN6094_c0_g1_i1:73-852(-)
MCIRDSPLLGNMFLEVAPVLKCYQEYYEKYDNAVKKLQSLRDHCKKFNAAVIEQEKLFGIRIGMEGYLILPIQRLPRYGLLIRELLKSTPKDHMDYNGLQDALGQVQIYAGHLDQEHKVNILKRANSDLLISAVSFFMDEKKVSMHNGKDLIKMRNSNIYNPDLGYIVLPTNLGGYGWIRVENISRTPVELISMKRDGKRVGHVQLRPFGQRIFVWKGDWVIEITEGYSFHVQVLEWGVGGGQNLDIKKEKANALMMAA